jgi:hypothetical protein
MEPMSGADEWSERNPQNLAHVGGEDGEEDLAYVVEYALAFPDGGDGTRKRLLRLFGTGRAG